MNIRSWLIILILFTIGFIAMMFGAVKPATSVVGATTDNLMSEERAELMLSTHGEVFTEYDME